MVNSGKFGEALSSLSITSSPAMVGMLGVAAGFLAATLVNGGALKSRRSGALSTKGPLPSYPTNLPSDEKAAFLELCDLLSKEIVSELRSVHEMPEEALAWVTKMIDYNVKGGKLNRGLAVVDVKRTLEANAGRALGSVAFARACVLGWAIEWLQAFFLVADDVMDDSVTRRGQPCWFRQPHVKLIAINDSFLLEAQVFQLLRRHFGHEDYYLALVELFREVILQTELGQMLDLTSQPMDSKAVDLSRFTLERYRLIVKYKTAFYTFYLPIACGLIMSGVQDESSLQAARHICLLMGEYFQIQDDYLDCYGDPKVIGKIGTDIKDNKCSWLVVQALDRATPTQRKVLEAHYGKHTDDDEAKVKALYVELKLESVFKAYEEQSYASIKDAMATLPANVPTAIFEQLLKKIYKRAK